MTGSESIRILLVDDHAIVREGYRSLLAKQPGMEVVAEAADGAEAYSP
jgi:two-component system, NarL family, invasion response regulator UvrY